MAISQSLQSMLDGSLGIAINVPFIIPKLPTPGGLTGAPTLLGLATAQSSTGGSLAGGHNYYYYLTAIDSFGDESPASTIPIEVVVPPGTNTNQVEILGNNFLFDKNAVKYNVYRSIDTPLLPLLISSGNSVPTGAAFTFTDSGLGTANVIAPCGSLNSINLYWRVTGTAMWHWGARSQPTLQILDIFSGSALSSNWTITEGGFSVASGLVSTSSVGGDSRSSAVWNANASGNNAIGADQWAQCSVQGAAPTSGDLGPAVRVSSSAETYYAFHCGGGIANLIKNVAGAATSLASVSYSAAVGDLLYIGVQGTSLVATITQSSGAVPVNLTHTDSSISSGQPGIAGYATSGSNSIGDFQAGNLLNDLQFFVPLTFGGDTLDIQLRPVDQYGNETSDQIAPLANYTITPPPPTIQLPAHLSYVPESNPLTAVERGIERDD